ncbi:hypothetical protein D3C81_965870 [compost metagenome]
MKIVRVIFILLHLDRYTFHDLQTIPLKPFNFAWIVGHKLNLSHAKVLEDLSPNAVVA